MDYITKVRGLWTREIFFLPCTWLGHAQKEISHKDLVQVKKNLERWMDIRSLRLWRRRQKFNKVHV